VRLYLENRLEVYWGKVHVLDVKNQTDPSSRQSS
jgi:hypothetical protein